MCEVAALLAEAMALLLKDADPRACQLRLRYEQLVLQNDVSSLDIGGESFGSNIYPPLCGRK